MPRRFIASPARFRRALFSLVLLGLVLVVGAGVRAQPAAPPPATPAGPAATELDTLLRVLRDDAQRAALLRALEQARAAPPAAVNGAPEPAAAPVAAGPRAPEEGAAPEPPSPAPEPAEAGVLAPAETIIGLTQRAGLFAAQLLGRLVEATRFEGFVAWGERLATDARLREQVLALAWKLALVVAAGFAAERSLRFLLRRLDAGLARRAREAEGSLSLPRRGAYLLGHLLLDLLPVAGLLAAALAVAGSLATWPSNRLIMEAVAIAYAAARAVMAVARLFFAPHSARLRLLPVSDETAAYATIWIHRIALTLVGFFAASELALFFGIGFAVTESLWRIGLLVTSLLIALVVLQNRAAVTRFLRAPALAEGEVADGNRRLLRGARNRVAEAWHLVVICWMLAAWALWALEVERGLERLATASGVTVLIFAGAKALDEAIRLLLARAFRVGPEAARLYPGLEARANRYLPALQGAISAVIVAIALVLALQSWGLPAFAFFGDGRPGARLLAALTSVSVTLVVAVAVWEVANAAIQRNLAALPKDAAAARSARARTLLPLARTALGVVLVLIVGLTTLSEIGVNVAPLLAGAGVVGLAIGFGSQTLVRDIITGVFLLLEDAVAVGDTITVGGLTGTVERLSIRSIRLRALDGSVHIVPFSAVTTVTNQTRDFGYAVVDLALDYACDPDAATAMLREIGAELREDEAWAPSVLAPIEVMGVERLTETSMVVRARVMTPPARRWAVGRELNRRIKLLAEARGVRLYAAPRAA